MKHKMYDTEWLLNQLAAGKKAEFLFFWGHRAKPNTVTKACFIQWWPSSFIVEDKSFATAEHWMMFHKAKLFGDDEIGARILENPDPGAAKGLGRKVSNFDPEIWDKKKTDIVIEGNLHKFRQNNDILYFLLATRGRVLVEASPVDSIWGIGLAQDHEDARSPSQWKGPNLLGFSLMTVRDLLES